MDTMHTPFALEQTETLLTRFLRAAHIHTGAHFALRLLIGLVVAVCVAAGPSSRPVLAVDPPGSGEAQTPLPASDALLIGVQPGTAEETVVGLLREQGLMLERYWPEPGLAIARPDPAAAALRAASVAETSAALAQSPLVRYAEPDQLVWAADSSGTEAATIEPPLRESRPNDPLVDQQWAVGTVRAVAAWNIAVGDPKVVIAVIDSGYDINHPDIDSNRIWINPPEQGGRPGVDDDGNGYVDDLHGWDWVDDDNQPGDDETCGHGTHVLGTIAATTNNALGVAGLGRNLTVMPLRILHGPRTCGGYVSDMVTAAFYAVDRGVSVINLSLTLNSPDSAMYDAIKYAYDQGVVVVAATGNSSSSVLWPAAYLETIAVAATDPQDERAYFSSYGAAVDVAAPGVDVLSTSTSLFGGYEEMAGTSMATPHVSTLVGLLLSLRPDLTLSEVVGLIAASAKDVNAKKYPGDDEFLGAGRVDFYAALLQASASLTLKSTAPASNLLLPGQSIDFGVKVLAPAAAAADQAVSQGVAGAVVYAQVLSVGPNAASPALTDAILRDVTDQTGSASFALSVPVTAGSYKLQVQVGQAVVSWPFSVIATPGSVDVSLEQTQVVVGSKPVTFTVEVRDTDGELEVGETSLTLSTSLGAFAVRTALGTFASGSNQMAATAIDGIYRGMLIPGTVAGIASLTATAGLTSGSAKLVIMPGAPSRLVTDLAPHPVALSDAIGEVYLSFQLLDRYGNPVIDSAQIDLVASIGQLSVSSVATVRGSASATLTFPLTTHNVTVWAYVVKPPDTDIRVTITVSPLAVRAWMPTLHRQK